SRAWQSGGGCVCASRRSTYWRQRFRLSCSSSSSEVDHRTDARALVHQVEGVVDLVQPHGMGDEGVERNLALLRLLDVMRQLGASAHAAEGRAAPHAAGDQLERAGGDFLAGAGHADDYRFA